MPPSAARVLLFLAIGIAILSNLCVLAAGQALRPPPPPPPILLPGQPSDGAATTPHTLNTTSTSSLSAPPNTIESASIPVSIPSPSSSSSHIEPIQPMTLPSLTPVPVPSNEPRPQGSSTSVEELAARIGQTENRLASIEDRLTKPLVKEVPASTGASMSFPLLLSLNILTFVLILYLFWKARGVSSPRSRAEESKPLKNVKDYMRRYLSQGYTVANMKNFLITQGYPKDLVERASREIDAEGR